jgi:MYXO-CTERM domain-containing protein
MQRPNPKFTRPGVLISLAAAGIAPLSTGAHGAVVYGNFDGTDLNYLNVTETPTQLPGPTPTELFGPPVISGDTLQFTPSNFTVSASGGSLELQDSHLSMNIVSADSNYPKFINLIEGGGWAVGGGTSATTAQESLDVNELFITAVNGVSINPIVVNPTITFTDTNSGSASVVKTADTIEFLSSGGVSTGTWNADASFNLNAALAAAGLSGNVTGMTLGLDNQLDATSEANSLSLIDKKFFDVTATTPVPEPATGGMALLAVAGFATRRRSRVAGSAARSMGSVGTFDTTGGTNAPRRRRGGAAK